MLHISCTMIEFDVCAPDRLLEIDLKDLGWKPLCNFLGKDIPDVAFPRLNESSVFRNDLRNLHWISLRVGILKALVPILGLGCVMMAFKWLCS